MSSRRSSPEKAQEAGKDADEHDQYSNKRSSLLAYEPSSLWILVIVRLFEAPSDGCSYFLA